MYCFAVSLRGYYVVLLFVEILTLIVYLNLTLSLSVFHLIQNKRLLYFLRANRRRISALAIIEIG